MSHPNNDTNNEEIENVGSPLVGGSMNLKRLRVFRVLAHVEGASTLLLFGAAMPLKYLAGLPIAVKIMGPIHGFLFLGLVLACVLAIRLVPIGLALGMAAIVGAVVPFGPFVVDRWLKKLAAPAVQ